MRSALMLAKRGMETTHPNPRVGCVIVSGAQIVGAGWHMRHGEPHAEVFALREAGVAAKNATLYLTLEPCASYGRASPCVDAVVAAGIGRVVIAMLDPHSAVNGRGIQMLRDAGIPVDVGLLADEARELNLGFISCITRGRPWVRLKLGMSLDARSALASGESQWITSTESLADVQEWRARSSAIMTGSGTAIADNPRLTVRRPDQASDRPPTRVLIDRALRVPTTASLFDNSAPTVVFHAPSCRPVQVPSPCLEYVAVAENEDGLDLHEIMMELAKRELGELQVECGQTLAGSLARANLIDEMLVYIAPVMLGNSSRPIVNVLAPATLSRARRMTTWEIARVGTDIRAIYRLSSV
jgi:diaminohydroxyphosphoribosylaminopyrimidine deaminase/5-amino-6-(5-phosphoribosylamino)uracil reductase